MLNDAFKSWNKCIHFCQIQQSQDYTQISCFIAKTGDADNERNFVLTRANLLRACIYCCHTSLIWRKRQPVWRKRTILHRSFREYNSGSAAVRGKPQISHPDSCNAEPELLWGKSQSSGKPFGMSVARISLEMDYECFPPASTVCRIMIYSWVFGNTTSTAYVIHISVRSTFN